MNGNVIAYWGVVRVPQWEYYAILPAPAARVAVRVRHLARRGEVHVAVPGIARAAIGHECPCGQVCCHPAHASPP